MNRKNVKQGFTLAEIIITLTIMGVVAAMVIPSTIQRTVETSKRTKMRKAITSYEKIIETMRVTEELRGIGAAGDGNKTLNGFANSDGQCTNARKYFKIAKNGATGCQFKTVEDIWWDISTMSKPIVAFDNKGEATNLTAANANADDTNLAFYMTAIEKKGAFIANNVDEYDSQKILVFTKLLDDAAVTGSTKIKECSGTGCCTAQFPGQVCLEKTDIACQSITNGWTLALGGTYNLNGADCESKYRVYREGGGYQEFELYNNGAAIITGSYYVINGEGQLTKGINAGHPMMNDAKWDKDGNLIWFASNGFGTCSVNNCPYTPSPFDFDACKYGQSCWFNSTTQEWESGWQEPNWTNHEANQVYSTEIAKLIWQNYQKAIANK